MLVRNIAKAALVSAIVLAGVVQAAVTFDSVTGTGFVGKGDVQTALGWSNKQLQDNAGLITFSVDTKTVSEVSWVCTNANNENIQERERTTTTTVTGIVSHVERVRNQITGFGLDGYSGTPSTSSTTDGQQLNSCPAAQSTWYLSTPAGDPIIIEESYGLFVKYGNESYQL